MAKVVKTVFTCDICGESYFTEKEAKECFQRCKHKQDNLINREKWYEDNLPKYKVGDIVEVMNMYKHNFTNRYFRVERVIKPTYTFDPYTWFYEGELGYEGNDEFDLHDVRSVEEDSIRLVIPCEEYNKKVEELMGTYKCKDKSHVRFCRDRCAFQVIIPYDEEKN